MSDVSDEDKAFQAALDAVSKKFEAKIPSLLAEITGIRKDLESEFAQLDMVEESLKSGVDMLLKKSHTLAGSAGQFGHPELTDLARAIEEMCLSIVESEFKNPDAFPLLFEFSKDLENYKF